MSFPEAPAEVLKHKEYRFSKKIEGESVYFFGRVSSTMDIASVLLKTGDTGIIVAEEQESGRGRYGRMWFSLPGGLYFSWAIEAEGNSSFFLSELTALTLVETIRFFRIICNIKFPNDIISENGKKLAGILIEKKGGFYNIGIGINVNNRVPDTGLGISMSAIAGRLFPGTEEILARFITFFNANKKHFAENEAAYLEKWSDNLIK